MKSKKTFLFAVACAFLLYSRFIETTWIEVVTHERSIGLQGSALKVVQLSDLHLSEMGTTEERVLSTLLSIEPDVIAITGDAIDDAASIEALEAFLQKLPEAQKVAVLGNWEHWSDTDKQRLREVYARTGVTLLVNECLSISSGGSVIRVAGLDDHTAGQPNLNFALSGCDGEGPLILLQHLPGLFEKPSPDAVETASLILSGHTHGGQLALGGYAIFTPRGSGDFVAGWYPTDWGDLYVSRGIGTSIVPFRFSARPEIPLFVLK